MRPAKVLSPILAHSNHSDNTLAEMIHDSWCNTTPEGGLLPNCLHVEFRRGRG